MKILRKIGCIISLILIIMTIVNLIVGEFSIERLGLLGLVVIIFIGYLTESGIFVHVEINSKSFEISRIITLIILILVLWMSLAEFTRNIGI